MLARTTLALITCLAAAFAGDPEPTTRVVPTDFATITAAIDASGFGDEIIIKPGVYNEALTIQGHSSLTIRAKKPGSVRVNGDINILEASNVTLHGLVVTREGGEVLLGGLTSNCRVERVEMRANETGGFVDVGNGNVFERCYVENAGIDAYYLAGTNAVLSNSTAIASEIRFVLAETSGHVIRGCIFKGSKGDGIVAESVNTLVIDNTIIDTADIAIGAFDGATVHGNRIRKAGSGIRSFGTQSVVTGNRIAKVEGVGIEVREPDTRVVANTVAGAVVALSIESNGVAVLNNHFRGSAVIDIRDAGDNTIFHANRFKTFETVEDED